MYKRIAILTVLIVLAVSSSAQNECLDLGSPFGFYVTEITYE